MKGWKNSIAVIIAAVCIVSCRQEASPPKPKIEKLTFEESAKAISVGDVVRVNIAAEPKNAKNSGKIEYKASDNGIIDIKADSSNDGVVFEGIKQGSTVITAKVNGVVDYCNVVVNGSDSTIIPHIVVPNYVLESPVNERRSITATLAGGTPVDNGGFVWMSNNEKSVQLVAAGNVGVIDTLEPGESVITISHPKAAYNVNVLVFVLGNNETPVYISTDFNVINMKKGDGDYNFMVELHGGTSDDNRSFIYEVVDGKDIIDVIGNNNIGTISVKEKGIAKIGVSHIKAKHRLDIIVIVNEEIEHTYIDVNKTLLILNKNETDYIDFDIAGNVPDDYRNHYVVEVDNNDSISVVESSSRLMVNAKSAGKTVISIDNKYVGFKREILVIVNSDDTVVDNEVYINTNQNIITMEAGGNDAVLSMMLVGGIEADRNNFVWTVDDSTIINVESADGRVEYYDIQNRSMVSNIGSKYEAKAVIKAKKVGTAAITLENPKSKNNSTVIVKVYQKGTFGAVPVVLSGNPYYKVEDGKDIAVTLGLSSGNRRDAEGAVWEIEDTGIADVVGSGFEGVITGKKGGVTTLRVKGANLKHDFTAVVMVGSEEFLSNGSFIYVHNPYMSIIKNNSLLFKVICENMDSAAIGELSVVNNSPDIIEVLSYRNSVNVTGIQIGRGEIVIQGPGTNTITVIVNVEDYAVNPDKPYYLRSDVDIQGVVKGGSVTLSVDLVGGSEAHYQGIIWTVENSNVTSVSGSGRSCKVDGKAVGQTVVTVNHLRSNNTLSIVIYVAENEESLRTSVILYVQEPNILLGMGEEKFITVITNADAAHKSGIDWEIGNAEIVSMSVSVDRVKALIKGTKIGSTTVNITSNTNIIPTVLYISVIDKSYSNRYINVPSIIEAVAGGNITINAVVEGISDKYAITWSIADDKIATLYANGDSCMVYMLRGGTTDITVEYKGINFKKKIVLVVYNTQKEMMSRYVIGSDQSRYVINKGDVITVGLAFGMRGYPEHEVYNIRWQAGDNNVVEVTGNGKTAAVKGLNIGIGIVTVESDIANSIEIEVEVRETGSSSSKHYFAIAESDKIKGIVVNDYADIEVRVYNRNNALVENIRDIEYIVENDNILRIADLGTMIRVTAKSAGQSYVTLKHDLVEDARILIYTAESQTVLNDAYPVMVDTNNYLLHKGSGVDITVRTKDNDVNKINNIQYALERNNGVISIAEKNKRELVVRAEETGSDVIVVRYNNAVMQRIYVSVTDTDYDALSSYIITENIIGMVVGSVYETSVTTNVVSGIYWSTSNAGIVRVLEAGKDALIMGVGVGRAYIVVRSGNIERHILAVVCADEEELRALEAANIDQRYYRISREENLNITLFSKSGSVAGETTYSDYYNNGNAYGNVIAVHDSNNGMIRVQGKNEGVAAIRVRNSYYNMDIVVYVEVYNRKGAEINVNDNNNFITAGKTLYVIGLEDTNVIIDVAVTGNGTVRSDQFIWDDYDDSIIDVQYNGSRAVINPLQEGQTEISVSNIGCANILKITVIVGDRYEIEKIVTPYIYMEKSIYEITRETKKLDVYYSIMNVGDVELSRIGVINHSNNVVNVAGIESEKISINIVNNGVARLDIIYGELSRDVYIVVNERIAVNNVFLTTSENFVIASVNDTRTVNVALVGYDEINSSNYTWTVDNLAVVQVVGNGGVGHIYGKAIGEAVITVRHNAAAYPLYINVKIAANAIDEKAVYLTTQMNVIETVVSDSLNYVYVQKIGGNVQRTNCQWTVDDQSVISLNGNGLAATYTAKKTGVARISVKNEESNHILYMVIIVKNPLNNNKYIFSVNNLVMVQPGGQERITVSLANGDEKDSNKFNWHIYYQNPTSVKVASEGGNVISIMSSNDECRITALNEGTARIRVTHDKADLPLYITVYVTYHKVINFSVNQKEIIAGDSDFIGINVPTYEYLKDKVKVYSENTDICDVIYTNNVLLLTAKQKGRTIVKARIEGKEGEAELYVNVVDEIDPNINRIVVSRILYNLNVKSGQTVLNAALSGVNATDVDNDDIIWELDNEDIISVYPDIRKGRQIRIVPKGEEGNVVVTVRHRYVDVPYYKQILIIVSKGSDNFSLDKYEMTINSLRSENLTASILGGTGRDYNEIIWTAKMQQRWDGTFAEIVRVMGSGREVVLYPMNDGECEVMATYNGKTQYCLVKVVSDYYISFRNLNERMYPGEERDLLFDIRPPSANIQWILSDWGNENIVTYTEIMGSPTEKEEAVRRLRVKAHRTGQVRITGLANGKMAAVNVMIVYDYRLNVEKGTGEDQFPKMPVYNNINGSSDGRVVVKYWVYPNNTYIKLDPKVELKDTGLEVRINRPNESGEGTIEFIGTRELWKKVDFMLYEYRANDRELETPAKVNGESVTDFCNVHYRFKDEALKPIPYFVRNDGAWSQAADIKGNRIDGERAKHISAQTGQPVYDENTNTITEQMVKNSAGEYTIYVGDGEQHFIMFDKEFENSVIEIEGEGIISASVTSFPVVLTAENVMTNGRPEKVIKIKGGKDHIIYDRALVYEKPYVSVRSNYYKEAGDTAYTTNAPYLLDYVRTHNYYEVDESLSGWDFFRARSGYVSGLQRIDAYAFEARNRENVLGIEDDDLYTFNLKLKVLDLNSVQATWFNALNVDKEGMRAILRDKSTFTGSSCSLFDLRGNNGYDYTSDPRFLANGREIIFLRNYYNRKGIDLNDIFIMFETDYPGIPESEFLHYLFEFSPVMILKYAFIYDTRTVGENFRNRTLLQENPFRADVTPDSGMTVKVGFTLATLYSYAGGGTSSIRYIDPNNIYGDFNYIYGNYPTNPTLLNNYNYEFQFFFNGYPEYAYLNMYTVSIFTAPLEFARTETSSANIWFVENSYYKVNKVTTKLIYAYNKEYLSLFGINKDNINKGFYEVGMVGDADLDDEQCLYSSERISFYYETPKAKPEKTTVYDVFARKYDQPVGVKLIPKAIENIDLGSYKNNVGNQGFFFNYYVDGIIKTTMFYYEDMYYAGNFLKQFNNYRVPTIDHVGDDFGGPKVGVGMIISDSKITDDYILNSLNMNGNNMNIFFATGMTYNVMKRYGENKNDLYFSDIKATHFLTWKNVNDGVVVPGYILNYYPFRYSEDGSDKWAVDLRKRSDARPMPSVNTGVIGNNSECTYIIRYKTFSFNGEDTIKEIKLKVIYEKRPCHRSYNGNLAEIAVNYNWGGGGDNKTKEYYGKLESYKDAQNNIIGDVEFWNMTGNEEPDKK